MRTRNADVAADIVQDTWAAGLSSLHRFAGRSTLSTWFHAILRKKLADHYRRSPPVCSLEAHQEVLMIDACDPGGSLDARRSLARAAVAIAALPPRQRRAIELCALQGLDREEAARRLAVNRTTLRVTLWRGRERLRAALGERRTQSRLG